MQNTTDIDNNTKKHNRNRTFVTSVANALNNFLRGIFFIQQGF